jgi:hypothetical protein
MSRLHFAGHHVGVDSAALHTTTILEGRILMLAQLWLPIVVAAIAVFVVSSILHMALRFWHGPDCRGFSNEAEVGAAIRNGNNGAGMYMIPYCTPEMMKDPSTAEKMKQGPVGVVYLRQPGMMNLGAYLGSWFAFCLLTSFLCAVLAAHTIPAGADHQHVLHVIAFVAAMAYGLAPIPNAIWWGQPWPATIKHVIDGVIYGGVTGLAFCWLWPA